MGDSRAYLISPDGITLITHDHTLAAELEQLAGQSGSAPGGAENVLTRCLGTEADVEIELPDRISLTEGQAFLLCSDGLSNMVKEEEMLDVVLEHSPHDACRLLIELARERGGPDNITLEVAKVLRG